MAELLRAVAAQQNACALLPVLKCTDQSQLVSIEQQLHHGVEHAPMRFAVDRAAVGKEVVKVR